MRHAIDPKIDCVFKALLGSEENRNLLIHFLNAFLVQDLAEPLVWVDILNPYNDKEFLSDKLSIVDVKARDSQDRLYQIEIQLTSYAHQVETEDQRWLKFFKDGERLNDKALPDWMITQEMKQAMSTLSTFSEKDQQYYQYQARQEYLREQRTIQSELELANKREALALHEKNLALAEVERLKALLAQKE